MSFSRKPQKLFYWISIQVICRRLWLSLTLLLLLCSFDASSWPRLQEAGVPNRAGVPALKRSCGACRTRPCLPSYPHFDISSVFGGVLVQLEKLSRPATANRIRADISPCQLWHCYLPESAQRMGGIRKRGWWESVCATSSLFTKADHCWRSTWSQLRTPRGSFSSSSSSLLPVSDLQSVCWGSYNLLLSSFLSLTPSSVHHNVQFFSWVKEQTNS